MRIAQKLRSLVSSNDSAKPGAAPSQATLTPSKPGSRAHALKCAVLNFVGGATGDAAKVERRPGNTDMTIDLARLGKSLVHQHGVGIASASMPPTGRSGELRARYADEWSASAARMSQELNTKHVLSLERSAGGPSGSNALHEAIAYHTGPSLTGADYRSVFELGKQLAMAKVKSDLHADAKPESMPTNAYQRLVAGNYTALSIRQELIRGGCSPRQAQDQMLQAAEQMKTAETPNWSKVFVARSAPLEDTGDRTEVAVAEPTPQLLHATTQFATRIDSNGTIVPARATANSDDGAVAVSEPAPELRQVNTQQAVRINPEDVLAQWQALDDDLARRGVSAVVLPDHRAAAALDHLDEAVDRIKRLED